MANKATATTETKTDAAAEAVETKTDTATVETKTDTAATAQTDTATTETKTDTATTTTAATYTPVKFKCRFKSMIYGMSKEQHIRFNDGFYTANTQAEYDFLTAHSDFGRTLFKA